MLAQRARGLTRGSCLALSYTSNLHRGSFGALGITVSAVQGYNAFKSNNTNGMVQSGADMVAGGVGFLGPIGWAGSTAYFVGQRIDSWTGASDKFARWWTGYP